MRMINIELLTICTLAMVGALALLFIIPRLFKQEPKTVPYAVVDENLVPITPNLILTQPSGTAGKEQPVAITGNKRTKKYCRKIITQEHHPVIIAAHDHMVDNNSSKSNAHIYAGDVAAQLNAEFGMDKSRQSYADIWNNKISFYALPAKASLI